MRSAIGFPPGIFVVTDKQYLCIFRGIRGDEASFRAAMERYGLDRKFLGELIAKAPVVVKRDVELREARRYADILQEAGGIVSIIENGEFAGRKRPGPKYPIKSFEAFVMCSECGFKQTGSAVCERCGLEIGGL